MSINNICVMTFLFYSIFILGVSSGIFVLISNNMVYSALALIGVFLSSACLLILLKADFLGYLFIIIYVGAVSILFLFVIMNLHIKNDEYRYISNKILKQNYIDKLLFLLFLTILFFFSFLILKNPIIFPKIDKNISIFGNSEIFIWYSNLIQSNSINAINSTLYTFNFIYLIICGLILLVAMIGAIALTLEEATFNKKQNSQNQIWQELKKSITINILKN